MNSSCCKAPLVCSKCGGVHKWEPRLSADDLEMCKLIWVRLLEVRSTKTTLSAHEVGEAIMDICGNRFSRWSAALRALEIIVKDPASAKTGPGARYFVREMPK
jgi:hypothetical protein